MCMTTEILLVGSYSQGLTFFAQEPLFSLLFYFIFILFLIFKLFFLARETFLRMYPELSKKAITGVTILFMLIVRKKYPNNSKIFTSYACIHDFVQE